jgi:DNA-binding response OmpR family regulator
MTSAVLLYQNDASIRDVILEVLTDEGYAVIVCDSLAAVQSAAGREPTALALIDAWGPSYGVLAESERQEICAWAAQVPAIMLTARSWAHEMSADDLGLLALLSKPIDLEQLVETIGQHIARVTPPAPTGQDEASPAAPAVTPGAGV